MSNHLQISEQRYHIFFSNFKTVIMSVGPVRGVNSRPPTRQTGALQIDLTIGSYHKPTLNEFQVLNVLNGENFSTKIGVGGRSEYFYIYGGFGGGGGAEGRRRGGGGGGGGYSGGGSGNIFVDSCGGGGGSYNVGNNQQNECCYNKAGHGQVTMTLL